MQPDEFLRHKHSPGTSPCSPRFPVHPFPPPTLLPADKAYQARLMSECNDRFIAGISLYMVVGGAGEGQRQSCAAFQSTGAVGEHGLLGSLGGRRTCGFRDSEKSRERSCLCGQWSLGWFSASLDTPPARPQPAAGLRVSCCEPVRP